jgi:hypothetical protein
MDVRDQVASQLRTLSICHYVYAGLAACGSCMGLVYVGIGFGVGDAMRHIDSRGAPGVSEGIANMFQWLFGGIGVLLMAMALAVAVLCLLSARGMAQRRSRTLSLVTAGVCCVTGLLGVALGVFTFIVLLKPETIALYAESEHGAPPPPA